MSQPDNLKRFFQGQGLSEADALLTVDLCRHAADQAVDAITRVSASALPHLQQIVFMATLRFLEVNISESIKELWP